MNNKRDAEFEICKDKMIKEMLSTYNIKPYKTGRSIQISKKDELKIEFFKLKWSIKILIFLLKTGLKNCVLENALFLKFKERIKKRKYIKARLNYFDFVNEMLIDKPMSEIRIPDFVCEIVEARKEDEEPKQNIRKDLVFCLKDIKEEGYLWWKRQVAYYKFVGKI